MSEILGILRCLPILLEILNEAGKFLKKQFGDSPEKFLADAADHFKLLNAAQTPEEKIHAAQKLQSLLRRL